MPSLRYYLMVSQEEFSVEVFTRAGDSDIWSFQEYNEIDAIIPFPNLNFELKLSDIYEMITFEK